MPLTILEPYWIKPVLLDLKTNNLRKSKWLPLLNNHPLQANGNFCWMHYNHYIRCRVTICKTCAPSHPRTNWWRQVIPGCWSPRAIALSYGAAAIRELGHWIIGLSQDCDDPGISVHGSLMLTPRTGHWWSLMCTSWLAHLPLVPHICVDESGQHWFR